ncbi:MAG: SAM-dependent methyltransferase, partial [Litorivivens sp.]
MSIKSPAKSWFESWFDSPYYHLLYSNRDDNEADAFLGRLLSEISAGPKSDVLDLACGAGRHARVMSKLGHNVTGLDLSVESIAKAKSISNTEEYLVGDMRTFNLGQSFDCIFNLFTSFGYFEDINDNLKVLKRINEHLDDDGTFVLDYFNSVNVLAKLLPYEEKEMNNVHFSISKDVRNGHICKGIKIIDGEVEQSFEERVQLFHFEDFRTML